MTHICSSGNPIGSTFKTYLALNHFVSPSPFSSHLEYCNLTPSGLPAQACAHFQPFLHQPPENLYKQPPLLCSKPSNSDCFTDGQMQWLYSDWQGPVWSQNKIPLASTTLPNPTLSSVSLVASQTPPSAWNHLSTGVLGPAFLLPSNPCSVSLCKWGFPSHPVWNSVFHFLLPHSALLSLPSSLCVHMSAHTHTHPHNLFVACLPWL